LLEGRGWNPHHGELKRVLSRQGLEFRRYKRTNFFEDKEGGIAQKDDFSDCITEESMAEPITYLLNAEHCFEAILGYAEFKYKDQKDLLGSVMQRVENARVKYDGMIGVAGNQMKYELIEAAKEFVFPQSNCVVRDKRFEKLRIYNGHVEDIGIVPVGQRPLPAGDFFYLPEGMFIMSETVSSFYFAGGKLTRFSNSGTSGSFPEMSTKKECTPSQYVEWTKEALEKLYEAQPNKEPAESKEESPQP